MYVTVYVARHTPVASVLHTVCIQFGVNPLTKYV